MGAGEFIGAAGGLIGAVAGILAFRKAGEANRIAVRSNEIAAETRQVAEQANRHSETANAIATLANAIADKANRLTEEANEYQRQKDNQAIADARKELEFRRQAEIEARTAKLVHRHSLPQSVIPWSRSGDRATLKIRLYNEGPAVAHNVRLEVTFPTESKHISLPIVDVPVGKEVAPEVPVAKSTFGEEFDFVMGFRVTWRDGNGEQEYKTGIRIQGPWLSDWRTSIAPYPDENRHD